MSKKHSTEWHPPVEAVIVETVDPIEDTIEVGAVILIDGPIDPVPLGTGATDKADFSPPRHSAGPMPDFGTQIFGMQMQDKGKELAQQTQDGAQKTGASVADKAQDISEKVAQSAAAAKAAVSDKADAVKAVVSDKADTVKAAAGSAGGAAQSALGSAGMAVWTVAQRSPLQAIALILSIVWLIRNHREAASQPVVTLPDAAAKVGTVAGQVQIAAGNLSAQVSAQGPAQRRLVWNDAT